MEIFRNPRIIYMLLLKLDCIQQTIHIARAVNLNYIGPSDLDFCSSNIRTACFVQYE